MKAISLFFNLGYDYDHGIAILCLWYVSLLLIILIPHVLWTWLFIFVLLVSNLNCCSRRKCWPSWFQDLESYQPMGGDLSLVQLTAVIWCSFTCTKFTKPLHQTTFSTMLGRSWHWWLWLLRVRERSQLHWAGVFNWRRVYSLGNHSMFLGLNYPIIQPMIDHITRDDYRAMQLPFARGTVFTHHTMGFMNHHI